MKMANKLCKIVIDTNIWISFLTGKTLKGLQKYINSTTIEVVTCKEQIFELTTVLQRPKMQKYFSETQIIEFFDLLDESVQLIDLHTTLNICRDAKDNYLLALL
jgi:putative PIN family toxin of toxin-antitoxin system